MNCVLLVVTAYLIGAIPFGLLMGLARGVDIRQLGSRNIGATNAGRVLGKKWGYLCLALDILKGLVPVAVAGVVLHGDSATAGEQLQWLAVGIAAVLGHVFPVYLRFRGGKGVATTIGVALGIYPIYTAAMLSALAGYGVVRWSTGRVSLGSLTLAVVFPATVFLGLRISRDPMANDWPLLCVAVLLGLLIIVRHAGNIRRLLRGEEPAASGPAANTPPQQESAGE
jgi:glycerol-3-phosphate acyltransferase PlsY